MIQGIKHFFHETSIKVLYRHDPVIFSLSGIAQKGLPPRPIVNINHSTNFAQHVDFNLSMVNDLKVPTGWSAIAAATGLGKPRMLCLGAGGELYITRRDAGDVLMLKELNGDNKFDELQR